MTQRGKASEDPVNSCLDLKLKLWIHFIWPEGKYNCHRHEGVGTTLLCDSKTHKDHIQGKDSRHKNGALKHTPCNVRQRRGTLLLNRI